ncbi:2-dehydropantoate 2-reductase [soil metagenome]
MSAGTPKVTVLGAGAVGSHLAARLARSDLDVSVVARGPQLQAIQARGLRYIGVAGDFTVKMRATDNASELGPQDLVIVAVKAHSLNAALPSLRPLLGPTTPVIYAVNGIPWWYFYKSGGPLDGHRLERLDPTGALWDEIGAERALACVIHSPNDLVEPGVVVNKAPSNNFKIGEPEIGRSDRIDRVAAILSRGVPDVTISPNVRADVWRKLLQNLGSSLVGCLTSSTAKQISQAPALASVFRAALEEGARVAAALDEHIEPGVDAALVRMATLDHRSSMLQDLDNGRPMEIDAQFTVVQELSKLLEVRTPTLDTLISLLTARARNAGLYVG